jgi:hypothetical protein
LSSADAVTDPAPGGRWSTRGVAGIGNASPLTYVDK